MNQKRQYLTAEQFNTLLKLISQSKKYEYYNIIKKSIEQNLHLTSEMESYLISTDKDFILELYERLTDEKEIADIISNRNHNNMMAEKRQIFYFMIFIVIFLVGWGITYKLN